MSFHGGFLGCVAAVMLFCRKHEIPILSLGDITTAVGPIGLFLGRLANFINSEIVGPAGRPACPGPWCFPTAGRCRAIRASSTRRRLKASCCYDPRAVMIRLGALKRPGLILGSFIALYGLARIVGEFFREPDPQLGFLWGGLTMGMLLSVPMIIAGAVIIVRGAGAARLRSMQVRPRRRQAVTEYSPLQSEIRKLIKSSGPMPVWRYMELCLTHPKYGYYVSRDPLGREGDFTTAPEVSQMFGELLGLWAASVWKAMGSPPLLRLIELGPGRGTMMADALRALRVLPPLYQSLSIHLVEINPVLRDKQQATLSARAQHRTGTKASTRCPKGPAIIFANEYFDVLPIHQMVKQRDRLARADGRDRRQTASWCSAPRREPMPRFEVLLPPLVRAAPVGAVFEWRPDAEIMKIASRVRDQDGAALIIDYGHVRSDAGDTFQAIARHSFADPLKSPGQADVTAHVDFQALARAAEGLGARVHGPVPQGEFLKRLGIETRAVTLMAKASARGFRGHFGRAETAGRRRARRHGIDVQGARGLRTQSHFAGGLH